ncbi:hypothetical protein R3W88_030993 [Solanum pinnatisectum]|uniref:Uncharacterized protein n=1 Tax=Solanum pinnatisectum TaxID=50273 RepID=A0AAV9LK47_9SOLN|nr:hypothetical protein R3W88_030993 [Solanum pinnatisectum]
MSCRGSILLYRVSQSNETGWRQTIGLRSKFQVPRKFENGLYTCCIQPYTAIYRSNAADTKLKIESQVAGAEVGCIHLSTVQCAGKMGQYTADTRLIYMLCIHCHKTANGSSPKIKWATFGVNHMGQQPNLSGSNEFGQKWPNFNLYLTFLII